MGIIMSHALQDRMRRFLNPDDPLGPEDAHEVEDVEVASRLFDPHNKSFNTLLRKDISVVVGRRGSGKTALLNAYKYRQFLDPVETPDPSCNSFDYNDYDIVIDVVSYKQFYAMQQRVAGNPDEFRPIESVMEEWEDTLLDYFFGMFLDSTLGRRSPPTNGDMAVIRSYLHRQVDAAKEMIWGTPLYKRLKQFLIGSETQDPPTRQDAEDAVMHYLKKTGQKAVVIFDSMDEYPVGNEQFDRTIGALTRVIRRFNRRHDRVKIKLGLPSEIYPEVERISGNALKDLNVDQVRWTAMELAQIAAHRFRLFLQIHDEKQAMRVAAYDLRHREQVHHFWRTFFPTKQKNRYSTDEDALVYIARHTQLLPRQFLRILKRVILENTQRRAGSWFGEEAVQNAVEAEEPRIAGEIFGAFKFVYPQAERLGRAVFGNCPTVFSFDFLENRWRRHGRRERESNIAMFDTVDFVDMLIRMGILGVVLKETAYYYEGKFAYDQLTPFNIGAKQLLCIHPIFSKCFNCAGNEGRKVVIPQGAWIQ